uniref:Uncharacterized protein n=1 Tax=Physcomitrium patens TaxID=3218 RepID=A0A2K1L0Q6_PHYPA|nr:hypothetical protein PHYPA_002395 [Physcomitrium patens]
MHNAVVLNFQKMSVVLSDNERCSCTRQCDDIKALEGADIEGPGFSSRHRFRIRVLKVSVQNICLHCLSMSLKNGNCSVTALLILVSNHGHRWIDWCE